MTFLSNFGLAEIKREGDYVFYDTWQETLNNWYMEKEKKVYIIKLGNKRFNSKNFDSYESARKYVRRIITARFGKYQDNIGDVGFTIVTK